MLTLLDCFKILYKSEIIAQQLNTSWEPFVIDVESAGISRQLTLECTQYKATLF